ncbi:hypothetical protein BRC81_03195 [Halobacteriales archaeon QS_1_68_20]|nr:MAG: hypothetical protein BRC81_03195 [Halobacteriales archaeon QS_1_68_20]
MRNAATSPLVPLNTSTRSYNTCWPSRAIAAVAVDVVRPRRRIRTIDQQVTELQTENERLTDFASVVSHDLRSPLSVARGYLELAEETGDPETFEEVRSAHDRIGTIIDHTLSLARQGDSSVDPTSVDLRDVAEEAWRNVTADDADLGVSDVPQVDADEVQLLENLFRNAVERAGPDVEVRVGTLPDEGGSTSPTTAPASPTTSVRRCSTAATPPTTKGPVPACRSSSRSPKLTGGPWRPPRARTAALASRSSSTDSDPPSRRNDPPTPGTAQTTSRPTPPVRGSRDLLAGRTDGTTVVTV